MRKTTNSLREKSAVLSSMASVASSMADAVFDESAKSSQPSKSSPFPAPRRTSIFGGGGSNRLRALDRLRPSSSGGGCPSSFLERFLSGKTYSGGGVQETPEYHVQFLDDKAHVFTVKRQSSGLDLLNQVFNYLNLQEPQYFGLLISSRGSPDEPRWMDPIRSIRKQLKDISTSDFPLLFRIRYFPPAPLVTHITDELTRHMFVLQLRQDLRDGNLYASPHTQLKLCALCLQSDCGPYDGTENIRSLISSLPLTPEKIDHIQNSPLSLNELSERYKRIRPSMSAQFAECELLKTVSDKLDMYGFEFHSAYVKVSTSPPQETVDIRLGIGYEGLAVFQEYQKISSFAWNTISKVSYTHRRLVIRLSSNLKTYPARILLLNSKDDRLVFLYFRSYLACRIAYDACIDQHSFMKSLQSSSSMTTANTNNDQTTYYFVNTNPQEQWARKCRTMEHHPPFPRTTISSRKPSPTSVYDVRLDDDDFTTKSQTNENLSKNDLISAFERIYKARPGFSFEASTRDENLAKNRYKDILAYDQTRVRLKHQKTIDQSSLSPLKSDYINANYIEMAITPQRSNRYIASQGPLQSTCEDFWQMIYEQQIRIIVMLTTVVEAGRVKCHKYWPTKSQRVMNEGRFEIRRRTCSDKCEIEVDHRHLCLRANPHRRDREIIQFQCNWWPDHGVPEHADRFLGFLAAINAVKARTCSSTVLVHCSAGIGRTGVMILVETALDLLDKNLPVNPIEIVKEMRDQRYCMVQNGEQFRFACEAVLLAHEHRQNRSLDFLEIDEEIDQQQQNS